MSQHNPSDEGEPPHSDDAPRSSNGKRSRGQVDKLPKIPASIKSCNECRQQKLGCNVVKEPFQACSRCHRLGLPCKLDSDFKRVAKRHKHTEMQKEIKELRELVAKQSAQLAASNAKEYGILNPSSTLDSKPKDQEIENITVSGDQLAFLFDQFFSRYHYICPILDPTQSCDQYFSQDPLLGWVIVLVASRRYPQDSTLVLRLSAPFMKKLGCAISDMPQRQSTVKALAILCTWPIPLIRGFTKSRNDKAAPTMGLSELDPTSMLSGFMMQIALQLGHHRPLHAQDFLTQTREVTDAELKDRKLTWAICNIVSQSVSTSNGLPSITIYDWGLGDGLKETPGILPEDIIQRLKIEKFCQKITKTLYSDASRLTGVLAEAEQPAALDLLERLYQQLESESLGFSSLNKLYLLAARLHLHAFAFFISPLLPTYFTALSSLYKSATSFIQATLDHDLHSEAILPYCSNYILKNLVSASCALLKILNSTYAIQFDGTQGRSLFNAAVLALRSTSLATNDFGDRIAEALTRMWRAAGSGELNRPNSSDYGPLELRIQSRMNISHVHDCFLRWRSTINPPPAPKAQAPSFPTNTSDMPFGVQEQQTPYLQPNSMYDPLNFPPILADFDLFNSLDWNFDDNMLMNWS
ncbi:hypothetical protein ACMFMG_004742 [Clarireedia jacksonii]